MGNPKQLNRMGDNHEPVLPQWTAKDLEIIWQSGIDFFRGDCNGLHRVASFAKALRAAGLREESHAVVAMFADSVARARGHHGR